MTMITIDCHIRKTRPKTRVATRTYMKSKQSEKLEEYYQKDQYPDCEEKKKISGKTNIDLNQVTNWFQNRRAKERITTEDVLLPVAKEKKIKKRERKGIIEEQSKSTTVLSNDKVITVIQSAQTLEDLLKASKLVLEEFQHVTLPNNIRIDDDIHDDRNIIEQRLMDYVQNVMEICNDTEAKP